MKQWWHRDHGLPAQDGQWAAIHRWLDAEAADPRPPVIRRAAALREQSQILHERCATLRGRSDGLRAAAACARALLPPRGPAARRPLR